MPVGSISCYPHALHYSRLLALAIFLFSNSYFHFAYKRIFIVPPICEFDLLFLLLPPLHMNLSLLLHAYKNVGYFLT